MAVKRGKVTVKLGSGGLQSTTTTAGASVVSGKLGGSGYSRGGGGGGQSKVSQAQLEAYQQELARQAAAAAAKAAQEAKAKQEAIAKQRAAAEAAAKKAAEAKAFNLKLRNLSKSQQRQAVLERANALKAATFHGLQQAGARLTPQAQQLVNRYVPQAQPTKAEQFISKYGSPNVMTKSPKEKKRIFSTKEEMKAKLSPLGVLAKLEKKSEKLQKRKKELMKKKGHKTTKDILKINKLDAQLATIEFLKGAPEVALIPAGIYNLIRKPSLLKEVPKNLKEDVIKTVQLAKISPTAAVAKIGKDILLLKGTEKGFKILGEIPKLQANKLLNLNPKLLKIEKGLVKIEKGGTKLELKVGGVKTFEESLAEQAGLAGKKTTAVTSQSNRLVGLLRRKKVIRKPIPGEESFKDQTKKLLKKFDKGKITKKEFNTLQKEIRRQTKSKGQPRGVDLLERSLFFDPKAGLRVSRLALKEPSQAEASFLDLLRGKATLKKVKSRPQILVLEDFIERLPKTKAFASIRKKLQSSKKIGTGTNVLTDKELSILSKFQVTPSGKLKPIGSTTFAGGAEREVTLAPTEAIKRVKKLGTLKVGDKRIPILAIKIVKGKSKLNLIKKFEKLTKDISSLKKERLKLSKQLTKKVKPAKKAKLNKKIKSLEEKINLKNKNIKSISKKAKYKDFEDFLKTKKTTPRKKTTPKKRYPLGRKAISRIPKVRRRKIPRIKKRVSKRTPTLKRPRPAPRPPRRTTRPRPAPRPPRRTTRPRPAPRPPRDSSKRRIITRPRFKRGSKKIIILANEKKIKRKTIPKKKTQAFNVWVRPLKKKGSKRQPSLVKINKRPLTKASAQDLRNLLLDTSLARSGKIKKAKGKPGKPILNVPRGYAQKTKGKFRNYKIIKGKKKPLARGNVIEKARNILDTSYEKRRISLERRLRQLTPKKKIPKRKIARRSLPRRKSSRAHLKPSPAQLRALARGRRIRMNKLKKKR